MTSRQHLITLCLLFAASTASAQTRSPFEVSLEVDLSLTLSAGAITLGLFIIDDELPGPHCAPLCDSSTVNALDRPAIGNRSSGARIASDWIYASMIGMPYALTLIDVLTTQDDGRAVDYFTEALILSETLAVAALLISLAKIGAQRPRPYAYDPDAPEDERTSSGAARSFFSGHTAAAFSMATASSYLFTQRHPDSSLVVPMWLTTHALAATAGYLRVHSGDHFWSDVIVGSIVGSAVGLVVPMLHLSGSDRAGRGEKSSSLRVTPFTSGAIVGLSGAF